MKKFLQIYKPLPSFFSLILFCIHIIGTIQAQTIKVASIDQSRFNNGGGSDIGYTLNGMLMVDTALPKLTNLTNFGPNGIVSHSLDITHTFTELGSITSAALAPYDILFIGLNSGTSPIASAEQEAIKAWSAQPGKVVIVAEQPSSSPVTLSYGYTLSAETKDSIIVNNLSRAALGDSITKLFSGVFGEAAFIKQEGTSQGFFSTDCFSTVVAKNTENKPTIIFNSSNRDILIADTDFFTTVGTDLYSLFPTPGRMSDGSNIDSSNDADKVWGNLWAWAVNEVLNPGTPFKPIMATVTPACNGTNGTVTFTSPLGISSNGEAYQYSIDGSVYQSSPLFKNVPPGSYNINARTSSSCPATSGGTVVINGPQAVPIISSIKQPACRMTSGSITLTGLPMMGSYTITRNPGGVIISTGNGSTYIDSPVSSGTYSYTVTNANGCTSLPTATVSILTYEAPKILNIEIQNPKCGQATGEVKVSATGGMGILSYSIDGANYIAQPIFKNLTAKKYIVTVRDTNNCFSSREFELMQSSGPIITGTDIISTSCGQANGSIKIVSVGGVMPISYSLDSVKFQSNNSFDFLKAGIYRVVVKDSVGCTNGITLKLESNVLPKIDSLKITKSKCDEKNGSITVFATGMSPLLYSLDSIRFQTAPFFPNLKNGSYSVYLKDAQGCLVNTKTNVEGEFGADCDSEEMVYLPEAFTPNNDGTNDTWTINYNRTKLDVLNLTIFNRWGEPVYARKGFQISDESTLWDGFMNGEILNGIFAYKLEVQFNNGKQFVYRGSVHSIY